MRRAPLLRLGILGGTFDPIHRAHLMLARRALSQLRLDQVIFIPSFIPPHKRRHVTPSSHRMAMVRLAICGQPRFACSDIEIRRRGKSYTWQTLEQLQRQRHGRCRLYFIIGGDNLCDIPSWKNPGRILELATLVVANRSGYAVNEIGLPFSCRIRNITIPPMDVSSTGIRKWIKQGIDASGFLPAGVAQYIKSHKLYR